MLAGIYSVAASNFFWLFGCCCSACYIEGIDRGMRMALNIRNERVVQLASELAAKMRVSKIEAVRLALEAHLLQCKATLPLTERLKPLQDHVANPPDSDVPLDKSFFDELSTGR